MPMERDHDTPDERLLADLREHYARFDPPPPAVLAAAHAAIEVRDLDAQLAELLRDSALEDKELAGVRGIGQRLLTFGRGERFLEVDVAEDGDQRDLSGYVVPAVAGTLEVEHSAGRTELPVDDHGRFRSGRVPRGPVRLRVLLAGNPAFVTPWLPI